MSSSAKHSADMQRNGFMKDSFGFKMSKKVAELTQVGTICFSFVSEIADTEKWNMYESVTDTFVFGGKGPKYNYWIGQ